MTTHETYTPSPAAKAPSSPSPSKFEVPSVEAATPPDIPSIRLACIEVCNFRHIAKTRLELDEATTIVVGAVDRTLTAVNP